MTKYAAPLAALLMVSMGAFSTIGCELITAIDRDKIPQASGAGGAGGAGGMSGCNTGDDCPGTDTACQTRTCNSGTCGVEYVPAGTAVQTQTVGDCKRELCDGQGNIATEDDETDILDDKNPCTDDTCNAGTPANTPVAVGTACSQGTGTMCDDKGVCVECLAPTDCASGICEQNKCIPASCTDTLKNGTETDVDCGGADCNGCDDGKVCVVGDDCKSKICDSGVCQVPTCTDTTENGDETDVDCGGGTCNPCGPDKGCSQDSDCVGGQCSGTLCLPNCTDQVKNANETDVDCGGPTCSPCDDGKTCAVDNDCASKVCTGSACQVPSCTDAVKNGDETGVDCGGGTCPACAANQPCTSPSDCTSGVCNGGVCASPSCGDGVTNGAEQCDDGATASGDGCSATCTVESGYSCTGTPSVCAPVCGDGTLVGGEPCDDGDTTGGDGCSATCTVEPGFDCTGAPSICATTCGDGIAAGIEQCDDGNVEPNDGCDLNCDIEPGYSCMGAPSVCAIICGDGVTGGAETCDDGNNTAGDGCDAACAVESGYACTGTPSVCAPICGDGIITGAETCDDSNATAGDGCSATCTVEPGYSCMGAPSVCATVCGDGVKAGAEQCDDGNTASGDCCSSSCQIEAGCEIEPNNNATEATANGPFPTATVLKGNVSPAADVDWYAFELTAYSDVKVETFDSAGPSTCVSIDTVLELYASDGTTKLVTDDDDGPNSCSLIDPTLTADPAARHLAPGIYYAKVRAFNAASTFKYTLRVTLPAVCGNGTKEGSEQCDGIQNCLSDCTLFTVCGDGLTQGTEQCDDGNTASGDGCSSTCKFEYAAETEPNDTCSAANGPIALTQASPSRLASGSITPAGELDWFAFTIPAYADVKLETFDANGPGTCSSIDTVIQAFNSDCTTQLGPSKDQGGISNCSKIDPSVDTYTRHLAPGTYYVQVKAYSSSATFNYTLQATMTSYCGNGVKEGSEQCDGGSNCKADCTVLSVCGDGVKEGNEQCDDSNTTAGDGCSPTCTIEYAPEVEPNGTCSAATGPIALTQAVPSRLASGSITPAGDLDWFAFSIPAYADVKFETFDANGPGTCSSVDTVIQAYKSDCTTALGANDDEDGIGSCSKLDPSVDTDAYMRHLAPGTYYLQVKAYYSTATFNYTLQATMTSYCGNNVKEGSEECDGGAGCNTDCTIIPTCGDGIIGGMEQCDDGNVTSGDGCSSSCQWETTAEVEPNGTIAEADAAPVVISGSMNITGAINPTGDQDIFKVTVAVPTAVRFEVFDSSGKDCVGMSTMVLKLLDTMGATLKQDSPDTAASGIGVCPALVTYLDVGTYYIQNEKSTTGTTASNVYFLQVKFENNGGSETEPNDAQAQANPVTGNDVFVFGGHQVGTDLDFYAITVPNGKSLRIETIEGSNAETCESQEIDTYLTLYNAAGTSLGTDEDGGRGWCSTIDGTGATPRNSFASKLSGGTYYIQVKASSSSTSSTKGQFDYRLVVTIR